MKYKLLFGLLLASASLNVRADETSNLRLLEFMARHPQATKACAAVIAGSAAGGAVGAAVGGTCGAGILSGLFSGVKNGCIFSGLSATFNYLCDDQNQPSQPPVFQSVVDELKNSIVPHLHDHRVSIPSSFNVQKF